MSDKQEELYVRFDDLEDQSEFQQFTAGASRPDEDRTRHDNGGDADPAEQVAFDRRAVEYGFSVAPEWDPYSVTELPEEYTQVPDDRKAKLRSESIELKEHYTKKTAHCPIAEKIARLMAKMFQAEDMLDPSTKERQQNSAWWSLQGQVNSAQRAFIFGYRGIIRASDALTRARRKGVSEEIEDADLAMLAAQQQFRYGLIKTRAIELCWQEVSHPDAKPILDLEWYPTLIRNELQWMKKRGKIDASKKAAVEATNAFYEASKFDFLNDD